MAAAREKEGRAGGSKPFPPAVPRPFPALHPLARAAGRHHQRTDARRHRLGDADIVVGASTAFPTSHTPRGAASTRPRTDETGASGPRLHSARRVEDPARTGGAEGEEEETEEGRAGSRGLGGGEGGRHPRPRRRLGATGWRERPITPQPEPVRTGRGPLGPGLRTEVGERAALPLTRKTGSGESGRGLRVRSPLRLSSPQTTSGARIARGPAGGARTGPVAKLQPLFLNPSFQILGR